MRITAVRYFWALVALISLPGGSWAQEIRHVPDGVVHPDDQVHLELAVHPQENSQYEWNVETGKARIIGPNSVAKVLLVPDAPGSLVVRCKVVESDGQHLYRTQLLVAGPPNHGTTSAGAAEGAPNTTPAAVGAHSEPGQHSPQVVSVGEIEGDIVAENYVPSGYEGDANDFGDPNHPSVAPPGLTVEDGSTDSPQSPPACTKITFNPKRAGWAALAYLPADAPPNGVWGATKGHNYSHRGYQSIRVFARGVNVNDYFPRIQFKSGDATAPQASNQASYQVTVPPVRLNADWQEFCLDLRGKDLSNVFSPLTVVVTKGNNPRGATFYIDTMHFSHDPCPRQ